MTTHREEGTSLALGFGKVQRAAACGQPLVPVVLQDADSSEVLFVGYANREAVDETVRTGKAVLWSTSRHELWRKGASSGDELVIVDVRVNCEQNSLLYLVRSQTGGACHTSDARGVSRRTCYYRRVSNSGELQFVDGFSPAGR